MKTKTLTTLIAATAITLCTGQSQIIFDDFTGTDGTVISSHAPNTNLPGGSYSVINLALPSTTVIIQNNKAQVGQDSGAAISIASSGGYTKPSTFTISGDLNVGTLTGDSYASRGVGLGFYNLLNGSHGFDNFLGLCVSPDTGALKFLNNGPGATPLIVQSIAYNGTWVAANTHSLSYTVNTTTGNFSNIVLDGSSYAFSSTTLFTNAETTFAGFYGSSSTGGGKIGTVDNFSVVPEPTTWALAAAGLMVVTVLLLRRRMA